jgi:hypothetical protein
MRYLPYFKPTTSQIHYRSKVLDLTLWTADDFKKHSEIYDSMEFWSLEDEQDPSDVICIAEDYGTSGCNLWLLVKDCEIIEEQSKAGEASAIPVKDYFSNLEEQYETLTLIPGGSRVTIEMENVPEHEGKGRITLDEVNSQTQEWRTDLDIQYVRQIYRDHGWPSSFSRKAASRAIDNWLEPSGEDWTRGSRGYGWEQRPDDWV